MEKRKFDTAALTTEDLEILADFKRRRQTFDDAIHAQQLELFTCPGCAYPTLDERNVFGYCPVCDWEDDGQDDDRADEVWGGPNSDLSLTENRLIIGRLLQDMATDAGGQVNTDLQQVIAVLDEHYKLVSDIRKSIPSDAPRFHPGWDDYRTARKELYTKLISHS